MIIYGASGHGKVIIGILEANGIKPMVIWDDAPKENHIWQYRVQRPDNNQYDAETKMIIAIGDNRIRKLIAERNKTRFIFHKLLHRGAYISERSEVGSGTVVMYGAVIHPDASIGRQCIINTKAIVEHDCQIGDFVHLSPNATLCGNVTIGEGTHAGAGCVIIPGIKIGRWCTIGAGAVIIRDIPDYSVVVGNPGRIIRQLQPSI